VVAAFSALSAIDTRDAVGCLEPALGVMAKAGIPCDLMMHRLAGRLGGDGRLWARVNEAVRGPGDMKAAARRVLLAHLEEHGPATVLEQLRPRSLPPRSIKEEPPADVAPSAGRQPTPRKTHRSGNRHADKYRQMSDEELHLTLKEVVRNLFHLRFQSATDRLETPSEIKKAKIEVARIKTIQRERERQQMHAEQDASRRRQASMAAPQD
jgi:large subunit ribosomal protein L29